MSIVQFILKRRKDFLYLMEVNYLINYWRNGEVKNNILDGDILEEIITSNELVLQVEQITKIYKQVKGIYIIYNTVNKKSYVGQTTNIYKRRNNHFAELRRGKHPNIYLQRSWNKYGENNFIGYVVKIVGNINDLNIEELFYIKLLQTRLNNHGYNQKLDTYSRKEENISKDQLNKEKPNLRKPVIQLDFNGNFIARYDSQEIAAIENDLWQSQVGYCCNKKRGSSGGYYWLYESEYNDNFNFDKYLKTIPKTYFKSKHGEHNYVNSKRKNWRVLQIDKNDNSIIKIWDNPAKTKEYGFNPNKIYECCSGKIKTHKGFSWIYEKDAM